MKPSLRLLTAALVSGLPAAARAQCAAPGAAFDVATEFFAVARLNGAVYDFSCLITPGLDGTASLSFGNNASALASYSIGKSTASAFLSNFSVTFDPAGAGGGAGPGSPNIIWSISTRTAIRPEITTDPMFDFAFAFGMPVAMRTYATASTSQGFSLSNANARTNEGVSLTPAGSFAPVAAPAGYPAALFGPTGSLSRQAVYNQLLAGGAGATGVQAGTADCKLQDPNAAGRARQHVCDFDSGIQPLDATTGSLGLLIQYRQFGVVSTVTNGTMIASTVPEPSTVALTAAGLFAVFGAGAARRRAARS